jgi:hypothetical protein
MIRRTVHHGHAVHPADAPVEMREQGEVGVSAADNDKLFIHAILVNPACAEQAGASHS